jgi:tetratricopeptide (TPR) repeat protein
MPPPAGVAAAGLLRKIGVAMHPLLARCSWVLLLLASAVSRAQAPEPPPEAADIRALLRAQKLDEAVAKGEAWSKSSPNDAVAWHWTGRAYAQQAMRASFFSKPGWASKLQHAFEHSVQLDGSNLEARFDLIQFYLRAPGLMGGDVGKARLQAAAIGKLDHARGHIALGVIAESEEDAKAAERAYRAAVAAAPDEARARVSLANLLSSQKRWAEARAVWTQQLERKPGDPRALYQLGKVSALSGQELAEGLESLDRYLAQPVRPDELAEYGAHWRRAQVLEQLGRKDDAVAALRVAVKLDPSAEGPKKDLKRLGG